MGTLLVRLMQPLQYDSLHQLQRTTISSGMGQLLFGLLAGNRVSMTVPVTIEHENGHMTGAE
jgi:hypothetical protein